MKTYEIPDIQFILLSVEDIITTSAGGSGGLGGDNETESGSGFTP